MIRIPGKYEGNEDQELARRLWNRSLDGSFDSFGESEYYGFHVLVDDDETYEEWYILVEDSDGFVTIIFGPETELLARSYFQRLEEETPE